jgi:hypothetical protein
VNLVDELHRVTQALAAADVSYAVCGGVAVTAYGATRSTKHIDLLVRPEDIAHMLELVRPLGFAYAALPMTFDEGTERARRVQRVSKLEGSHVLILDLIVADGPFEGGLDDRVRVDLPEGPLWLVSLDTLARMKRLAGRPQDKADLARLGLGDE